MTQLEKEQRDLYNQTVISLVSGAISIVAFSILSILGLYLANDAKKKGYENTLLDVAVVLNWVGIIFLTLKIIAGFFLAGMYLAVCPVCL